MARPKIISKEEIFENTAESMTELGTYKPQFIPQIEIYADMMEQYKRLTHEYTRKKSKYAYSVETLQGGEKKSPLITTIEALRKDILQYADRLMLNPKSFRMEAGEDDARESLAGVLKLIG